MNLYFLIHPHSHKHWDVYMLFDQDLLCMAQRSRDANWVLIAGGGLGDDSWPAIVSWFLDLPATRYRSEFWFELRSYFTLLKSHVSHFSCFPYLVILWLWTFSPSPWHLQISLFLSLVEWNHTYGVLWLLVPTLPCSVVSSHTYRYIFVFHSYQS